MARVIEAGGVLDVSHADGVNYGALMATANLYKVPAGKRLAWAPPPHGKHHQHPRIQLEDLPAWMSAVLEPVTIPTKLNSPHPAISALARGEARFDLVAKGRQAPALRLFQALVSEGLRRGYSAEAGAVDRAYRHRTANQQRVHLTITVSGHHFCLGVDDGRSRGYVSEAERRRQDLEVVPVHLQIINGVEHRTSRWNIDVTDERAGLALAQVLQELELRAAKAEEHRQQRLERERQERKRSEEAWARAREAYMDDYRAKALVKQVDRWYLAQRIDAYLAALEQAVPEDDVPSEVAEWIAWARDYRVRIDPLRDGLTLPVDHDPGRDKLQPYLPNGWSFTPYPGS